MCHVTCERRFDVQHDLLFVALHVESSGVVVAAVDDLRYIGDGDEVFYLGRHALKTYVRVQESSESAICVRVIGLKLC